VLLGFSKDGTRWRSFCFAPLEKKIATIFEKKNTPMISSTYEHVENVQKPDGTFEVCKTSYDFKTAPRRKTGVMLIGLGGNNGSTFQGGLIANQHNLSWSTKHGKKHSNFLGSLSQKGVVPVGVSANQETVYLPFKELVDLIDPVDIVVGGWDISAFTLTDAMTRAEVFDFELQQQISAAAHDQKPPLASIFYPDFIAKNQNERIDNVLDGHRACQDHVLAIRKDIRNFKKKHDLECVLVMWTANTERMMVEEVGVHDSADHLLKAVSEGHREIAPSLVFAVASVLEECVFLNGAPQNTIVPGLVELAARHNTFLGGCDFKSGQTKFKAVMADFITASGFKLKSVVSYNHLGNNDGLNLSADAQFKSKEISKTNVIDNIVSTNELLFPGESPRPDHVVVIKYVPSVRDDKRAMDEYISEIFMSGEQILSTYNICPDSLLAVPIMLDLIVFSEWITRVSFKQQNEPVFQNCNTVLSGLSFFFKAPCKNIDEPEIQNSLFFQRNTLAQFAMASRGLAVFNPLQF
jgi:myo-inositol-1-phosphate synthase